MLGRREFLQRLAASAAVFALDPFRDILIADDAYQNARLGLRVLRPVGWEFSSIADFAALRERQVIQGILDDDPHPLKDPHNLPVFLFEDPAGRDGEYAPSISLWDEPLHGPVPSDQARAHDQVMLQGFAAAYRGARVEEEPRPLPLNGAGGTLSRWSYWHDLDNGEQYRLSVRSLLVFRAPRVHTYHLVESGMNPDVAPVVWSEFIRSVSYDP